MNGKNIRILIAEDHETAREGIKLLVNAEKDLDIVAEAGEGPIHFDRSLVV